MEVFIFDLDDTLIDTANTLVPAALRGVADAIGVDVSRLNAHGKGVDDVLAPLDATPEMRARAAAVWYSTDVPPIEPLPGAREMLERLRATARLYLLTRGDPARQEKKIEATGLAPLFEEVVIRPIDEPGSKRDDIERILRESGVAPERCTVVGDDPDDELMHGAALGCATVLVPATPLAEIGR